MIGKIRRMGKTMKRLLRSYFGFMSKFWVIWFGDGVNC